jgi:hypothetical protein
VNLARPEHGGPLMALGHCDGNPRHHNISGDDELALLKDRASSSQDGAGGGEKD